MLGSSAGDYRSVQILTKLDPTGDRVPLGPIAQPSDLWQWAVKQFVTRTEIASEPSGFHSRATMSLLRTLDITGAGELLEAIFRTHPTPELARDLFGRGSNAGIEYYRTELSKLSGVPQLSAALLLAETGDRSGAEVIFEQSQKKKISGVQLYRAIRALDRYIQHTDCPPDERDRVIEWCVTELGRQSPMSSALSGIFTLLEREAKTSFGYGASRTIVDRKERRAAALRSVEAATTWWRAEKDAREDADRP